MTMTVWQVLGQGWVPHVKQLQRSKYCPVPQASPKDSRGWGLVLKEFVRRMKAGGHCNRKNYTYKDKLEQACPWMRVWPLAHSRDCPAVSLEERAGARSPRGQYVQSRNRTLSQIENFKHIKSECHSGEQREDKSRLVWRANEREDGWALQTRKGSTYREDRPQQDLESCPKPQ